MGIKESLKNRRSYYNINKDLPVSEEEVTNLIKEFTELVPDAFDMKSSRIVVALQEKQNQLWDAVYDTFNGMVPREKIDSFKAGAGTVLYFYDNTVVKVLQEQYPIFADNFPVWANHSSAMLQISIWSGLHDIGVGASLQHYNPVIDEKVRELFDLPDSYILLAQMPFGGIGAEPTDKAKENIDERVKILR